jgi:hypothetical protein
MASGHATRISSSAPGELSVAFSASRQADGSMSGSARFESTTGTRAVLAVDCLVVEGNLAKVGGEVLASNLPSLVGSSVVFHAEDNGEQPSDPEDRLSSVFTTGMPCTTFVIPSSHPGQLAPIVRGAVRVRE